MSRASPPPGSDDSFPRADSTSSETRISSEQEYIELDQRLAAWAITLSTGESDQEKVEQYQSGIREAIREEVDEKYWRNSYNNPPGTPSDHSGNTPFAPEDDPVTFYQDTLFPTMFTDVSDNAFPTVLESERDPDNIEPGDVPVRYRLKNAYTEGEREALHQMFDIWKRKMGEYIQTELEPEE